MWRGDLQPPPQSRIAGMMTADQTLPLVVVAGPTASGKSGLALRLAAMCGGVVINADSMQVYADLPILTAVPDAADRAAVPHAGYAVLDGSVRCSVAQWLAITRDAVAAARHAGQVPILTGGTGMYLRAALEGIAPLPEIDPALRAEVVALHQRLGGTAFRRALAELDPDLAARLEDGDSQRLIRGMEVARATGKPLSLLQKAPPEGAISGPRLTLLVDPPRPVLYQRIDARFPMMLDAGAAEEAAQYLARALDPTLPLMKAVGLAPVAALLRGEISRDEAIETATRDTRRFAKRQVTWFRHQYAPEAIWDGDDPAQYSKRFFEENLSKIIK